MSALRRLFAWRDPGSHPDTLRRSTVYLNTILMLVVAVATLPGCIGLAGHQVYLPLAVDLFGLACGIVCLLQDRGGRTNTVAAIHVAALLVVGATFALAHPAFADFGIATILLVPIYAGYTLRAAQKSTAMGATALALILSTVAHFSLPSLGLSSEPAGVEGASVAVFLGAGTIVALTGWRLSQAFTRYEHSQIRAFQHLVEHVQDAVVRYAADGDLLFISRSAETLFGCRRYQLTGSGLIERLHVLDRPVLLSALQDARHHGFAQVIEIRARNDLEDAATFFWVEISLSPITDPRRPDGPYEVIGILRDVTVRKDYENEIRLAHQAAEAASQTKSRFLATIGHELRTPLNAIVGFTDMMLNQIGGKLTDEHEEYSRLIAQSGQHLLGIVNMLLDMSKIEAGKFELNIDSFDPGHLVEPCIAMMSGEAEAGKVAIDTRVASDLPTVVGDERACRQMILNLLSNAIKFSPEGGTVTVAVEPAGTRIAISVADRGIGMSKEDAARIGEPFFQAHSGLDRHYEGAGLGLSIVRGLVDLHEGELVVQSGVGTGTKVTVLLPVDGPGDRDRDPDQDGPAEIAAPEAEPAHLSRTA